MSGALKPHQAVCDLILASMDHAQIVSVINELSEAIAMRPVTPEPMTLARWLTPSSLIEEGPSSERVHSALLGPVPTTSTLPQQPMQSAIDLIKAAEDGIASTKP